MAVLEEFKKQLVEDLARYMIEENEPRDQMWTRLKDEYGCDCQLLWERIRNLTIKKLAKMLASEDRTESIPSIAQMTANDWLVFDNILVHQNIDVIGKDLILNGQPESKVLWELFILVSSYHVETLPPEELVNGWYNLTKIYNTSGRYCSAMLLQLRWYQLKELVRTNFHSFWSIYQGNNNYMKQVPRASKLQKLIASKFGNILTEPFLSWQCLIKKQLVVQTSDLENCRRLDQSDTSNDDIEIIEIKPLIETIDLNSDSESDDVSKNQCSQVIATDEQCINVIDVNEFESKQTCSILDSNEEDKGTSKIELRQIKIVNVEGNVNIEKSERRKSVELINTEKSVISKDTYQYQELNQKMIKKVDERRIENIEFTSKNILECNDKETVNQYGQIETEKDDKIVTVKRENNCVEEDNSIRMIDSKLLMFPISYTKKLDHMNIFQNKNYITVKGRHFINCIEAESKPKQMKNFVKEKIIKDEFKEATITDSPKKNKILQTKSIRINQNLNKRSYSLKQLQKNPDFNVKLKNIPLNFYLIERNKRLLAECKPVTVDIERLFETKLDNNIENMSSIIKQEKQSYECENTILHVPSLEAILEKRKIVREFVTDKNTIGTSNSTSNDRNMDKQNFLALEVSPLCFNIEPPVKLVQFLDKPLIEQATSHTKTIEKCARTSSDMPIKEKLAIENVSNVKEVQNEINLSGTSFNCIVNDKSLHNPKQNTITIENIPGNVNIDVAQTNPRLNLIQCPLKSFQNDTLIGNKSDSKVNILPEGDVTINNLSDPKISNKSPKLNSCDVPQAAESSIRKQKINHVVQLLNDQTLNKKTLTKQSDSFFVRNNTLKEVVKVLKGETSEKTKLPLQNRLALFLTNVTNNESKGEKEKGIRKEETVILNNCDDFKENKIKNGGMAKITLIKNTQVTSGQSKNFPREHNDVQNHQSNKNITDSCTKTTTSERQSDLFIENKVNTYLPYQNPMINLQCENKQNSLYFIVTPLSNNTEPNKTALTKVDQDKIDNEHNKNIPPPNSLIVTRVSSEPVHSKVPHLLIQPVLMTNILTVPATVNAEENHHNVNQTSVELKTNNEIKVNENSELKLEAVSSLPATSISTEGNIRVNNSVPCATPSYNKEVIGRIEAKNGIIQITPHNNVEVEKMDNRNKRKHIVDVTDDCDSRRVKRKAIIFV